jgi:glutamate racemase
MASARERADITIVVTDSGLGGLSVAAELAAQLPASGIARSARIVFVNALLDDAIGYNDLKREADKLRVFDAALSAMESRYHPDLIVVACNTLSVLYDRTRHSHDSSTSTVGIVGIGADLIARQLAEKPGSTAVVFATRTTIESGAYPDLLAKKGIPRDHVVGQACHRLAGSIERGADSAETANYVRTFVAEAIKRLPKNPGPLVVSLNCTHYGYVRNLWQESFAAAGYPGVKVLDPNPLMADFVVKEGGPRRDPETSVSVEVVSKVPIGPDVQSSLGALLRTVSPETADALAAYQHDPALFSVLIDPSAIVR